MLRVGYYQFRPLFGKIRRNLNKVVTALQGIAADLIVLPELAFTGYHFKDRRETLQLAEDPKTSETVETLTRLCRQQDLYLVTGFAEKRKDRVYNSALLIGPGGIEHIYRKLHLFNTEKQHFDPGDTPLAVQEVRGARLGMMICFDWAFPEIARILALEGADILCHPSNLVLGYGQQAMLTRCLENKVFAITTNRYGTDKRPQGELRFTGKSQIVAPGGVLLNQAPAQREALVITMIDPDQARDKRLTPLNDLLADRRPGYYGALVETFIERAPHALFNR
jgi:predicted amidohydrolase